MLGPLERALGYQFYFKDNSVLWMVRILSACVNNSSHIFCHYCIVLLTLLFSLLYCESFEWKLVFLVWESCQMMILTGSEWTLSTFLNIKYVCVLFSVSFVNKTIILPSNYPTCRSFVWTAVISSRLLQCSCQVFLVYFVIVDVISLVM